MPSKSCLWWRINRGGWLKAAAAAIWALMAAQATAQETFKLRFNHVLAPTEAFHEGFTRWADRVKQRTKGGLVIEVFHSAQLGVEEDVLDQVSGNSDLGQNTDAARLATYVPGFAVINAPYFLDSLEQAFALARAPTVIGWQKELADRHGIRVVCFDWVQGFRHFFTGKPVRTPRDLNGLRIRTPPAPIWQETVRALGAIPVSMSFGDIYPGLQQQVIDGAELTYANVRGGRLFEVLKYANETAHVLLINFQVVSERWFQRLPHAYQTALVEECRSAGQETSQTILDATIPARTVLERRGMVIVNDIDLAAFRKAGERAYETLGLTAYRDRVRKEIGQ